MPRIPHWIIVSAVLLAGCKTQVASDIYLTDVASVASAGTALPFDLKLAFEVPSEDQCAEANTMLAPALGRHFGAVAFVGCSTEGFSNFANFTAGSEMVLELANGKHDSALPIYVGVTALEDGLVDIAYHASQDGLAALMADLPDEAKSYSDRLEVSLSATIHNDGAGPISLSVANAFVNGTAELRPVEVELARRKELAVKLSDVANATLSAGSWATIATVLPQKAP